MERQRWRLARKEHPHLADKGAVQPPAIGLRQRVQQHRCYVVATNDKDLKRRIRKIPGVPIMFVANHRYQVERMPDKLDGGAGHTTKF